MEFNAFCSRRVSACGNSRFLTKTLRVMKLTAIILLGFCLHLSAKTSSQTITYSGKDAELETVLVSVEKQTGFIALFEATTISSAKRVTISANNLPLDEFLNQLFADQPLTYSIKNNSIIVTRKKDNKSIVDELSDVNNNPPIKGRVLAEDGTPLSGASIVVKGKKVSTSTDADGFFSINADEGETLIISYIGFSNRLLKATSSIGSVTLEKSQSKLDEVQIVGYGTNTQRYQVGSVTKVTSEEISKQPVGNPLAALQGRVPGLVVTQSSGLPGSSISVRIRGQNSLKPKTSGNVLFDNPLYIINGVPFAPQNNNVNQYTSLFGGGSSTSAGSPGYSPFNSINPSEIESIEVLRDADATAIYGSRGSNGVVLITTKKGKKGKASVNANVYYGQSEATRTASLMNTEQYLEMRKEAYANDNIIPNLTPGTPGFAPDLLAYDPARNIDWVNTFIGGRSNVVDANASLSGGSENTQFLLGTSMRSETFILPGNAQNDRLSVNANFRHNSSDQKLYIDFTANYSFDKNNSPGNSDFANAFILPPNYPELKDNDGHLIWSYKGFNLSNLSGNPFAYLLQDYSVRNYNLVSNASIGYQIISGVTIKANFGYNTFDGNEVLQVPKASRNPINFNFGSAKFGSNKFKTWNIEPQIDINKNIFDGRFNFTIGSTFQKNINASTDIIGDNYSNDATLGTITGAGTITARDGYSLYKYNALFGRLNYIWKNKYIANFTARRDGSSRFGPSKQFGNFGSAGLGWIFSQESFVRENIPVLSYGKLRATYGTTGNDNIGDYQYIAPYTINQYVNYQGNVGYQTANLFNPDFSWSTTKKFEVGLEFGFFGDKVLGNATYYSNRSGNQLVQYVLPIQTGFRNVTQNAPYEVSNSGLELSLSTINISSKDFTWNTSFILTIPKNKLVSFPGIEQSPYKNTYVVGQPLSVLKKFVYTGINDTTGLFQFQDLNKDGSISGFTDFAVVGDLDEDFYGGFTNDFAYKGFRLSVFFQFSKGMGENYLNQIYLARPVGFANNLPADLINRWQGKGSGGNVQRLTSQFGSAAYRTGVNFASSSGAYGDASYVRLKTVSLSYNFSNALIQKIKVQSLKLFVNAQNLFTITSYEGNDPENRSFYSIPLLKTFVAGFNVNF